MYNASKSFRDITNKYCRRKCRSTRRSSKSNHIRAPVTVYLLTAYVILTLQYKQEPVINIYRSIADSHTQANTVNIYTNYYVKKISSNAITQVHHQHHLKKATVNRALQLSERIIGKIQKVCGYMSEHAHVHNVHICTSLWPTGYV